MSARPVGLSRDLPAARVMRAMVDQQDLVVWRSAGGTLAAWDNRCPHRGMALSHGFVRGENLACLYHGWHFGCESGGCSLIPSHPELTPPETIRTRAFSAREQDGVIWVAVSGEAEAPVDDLDGFAPLRSLHVEAAETTLLDAASDHTFPDARLRLLCNPIAANLTLLVVLIDAAADTAKQKAAARWCEQLRRVAEA